MKNFNPKSSKCKLFSMRETSKRPLQVFTEPNDTINIKQINISDKDKFGKVVYKGSKGGSGKEKRKKTFRYVLRDVRCESSVRRYYSSFTRHFNKSQPIGKLILIDGNWSRIINQI